MNKVSVIIPMYNVERVMARSVQSLYTQTLKNFEVIFVDDCSVDSTYENLQKLIAGFERQDIEVKIIRHSQNKGVAMARNTGLDNASGEYVYYLDADDYLDDDALLVMYEEAKNAAADIVGCEWLLSFENNARHMAQPEVRTGREAFEKMCIGVMRWNLWLFMVKRSLYEANGFRFIAGANMGEDMMLMMKIMLNVSDVSIIHRPLYHYIQTNSNAMTKNFAAYCGQVSCNIAELERYVAQHGDIVKYQGLINQLKLNLKLPLLISDNESDYKLWEEWFPESTAYAGKNHEQCLRTRMIQRFALKKRYLALKLYYKLVIRFVYGIIYR